MFLGCIEEECVGIDNYEG